MSQEYIPNLADKRMEYIGIGVALLAVLFLVVMSGPVAGFTFVTLGLLSILDILAPRIVRLKVFSGV